MQNELRNKILELKNLGMGYKSIAKELSITPSAVRNVCTSKYNDLEKYGNCKKCGIKIKQTPGKRSVNFVVINAE